MTSSPAIPWIEWIWGPNGKQVQVWVFPAEAGLEQPSKVDASWDSDPPQNDPPQNDPPPIQTPNDPLLSDPPSSDPTPSDPSPTDLLPFDPPPVKFRAVPRATRLDEFALGELLAQCGGKTKPGSK